MTIDWNFVPGRDGEYDQHAGRFAFESGLRNSSFQQSPHRQDRRSQQDIIEMLDELGVDIEKGFERFVTQSSRGSVADTVEEVDPEQLGIDLTEYPELRLISALENEDVEAVSDALQDVEALNFLGRSPSPKNLSLLARAGADRAYVLSNIRPSVGTDKDEVRTLLESVLQRDDISKTDLEQSVDLGQFPDSVFDGIDIEKPENEQAYA